MGLFLDPASAVVQLHSHASADNVVIKALGGMLQIGFASA